MRAAIVESSESLRELVVGTLERGGDQIESLREMAGLWYRLQQADPPQLVFLRWGGEANAAERVCRQARALGGAPVFFVAICDRGGFATALPALEAGLLDDIVITPLDAQALAVSVAVAKNTLGLREQISRAATVPTQTTRDPVTALWNHAAALTLLGRELATSRRAGSTVGLVRLLVIGLEAHPPSVADAVYRLVADALRASVRVSDWLTRPAEMVFVVVLPGCSEARAVAIAERIFRLATERLEASAIFGAVRVEVDANATRGADTDADVLLAQLLEPPGSPLPPGGGQREPPLEGE